MDATPTINPMLSAHANEWFQMDRSFIGYDVCPVFSTSEQAGEYPVFDKENIIATGRNIERSPGTEYKSLSIQLSDDSYSTKDRGIKVPVDDRVARKYRNQIDLDEASVQKGVATVQTDHERRAAAIVSDASITHTGVTTWTAANGDTILTDVDARIEAIRKACGVRPNMWIIPNDEWLATIKHNSQLITRIKNNGNGQITEVTKEALGNIVQVQVVVPECLQAINQDGATLNVDDIWDQTESYLVYAAPRGAPLDAPSAFRTFSWDAGEGLGDFIVETYREPGKRSNMQQVRAEDDIKITGATLAEVLTGI